MIVKVVFTVETADFGELEFRKEIENLIKEIDPATQLLDFAMTEEKEKSK